MVSRIETKVGIRVNIDPSNPMTLYVGTIGDGIFQTTDGASNWAAVKHNVLTNCA